MTVFEVMWSTPAKSDNTDAEASSTKRGLPSPFSPEDHLVKKNKTVTGDISDISDLSMDKMESSVSGATSEVLEMPSLDPDILRTVSIIRLYLKDEISDLVKNAVSEAVSEAMDTELQDLRDETSRLTAENTDLKTRVTKLENALDDSEQYSRRNSLRITNIPETNSDDTDTIVIDIAKTLNVDISPTDIDRSHRVGKPDKAKPRDILVKFATYRARQRLYGPRSALKDSDYTGVFLNEDLTQSRSKLLYEARVKVKGSYLKGAWSTDGRLFIKDFNDKVHRLKNVQDISEHSSATPVKRSDERSSTSAPGNSRESGASV